MWGVFGTAILVHKVRWMTDGTWVQKPQKCPVLPLANATDLAKYQQ